MHTWWCVHEHSTHSHAHCTDTPQYDFIEKWIIYAVLSRVISPRLIIVCDTNSRADITISPVHCFDSNAIRADYLRPRMPSHLATAQKLILIFFFLSLLTLFFRISKKVKFRIERKRKRGKMFHVLIQFVNYVLITGKERRKNEKPWKNIFSFNSSANDSCKHEPAFIVLVPAKCK